MEKKINIYELLKDCPKGMELYSPIYGVGVLIKVTDRIHVKFPREHNVKCFRLDGKVSEDGEIMLFPKGKTTWEGFIPPCKFKDGDIIYVKSVCEWVAIYKESDGDDVYKYVDISVSTDRLFNDCNPLCHKGDIREIRHATEEEKQKLFDAINANGYKWNAETKTLEKLVEPKFKVGDKIKHKCEKFRDERTIVSYGKRGYWTSINDWIDYKNQDDWELVPNKFDITTLIPFESKVLVRGDKTSYWKPAIFGCYMKNMTVPYYALGGTCWSQCVPYEGNEHLFGKTDDCDDFYKTWE